MLSFATEERPLLPRYRRALLRHAPPTHARMTPAGFTAKYLRADSASGAPYAAMLGAVRAVPARHSALDPCARCAILACNTTTAAGAGPQPLKDESACSQDCDQAPGQVQSLRVAPEIVPESRR